MLLCSNCPDEFNRGHVCVKCSKLFCSKHEILTCSFCGGSLEKLSLDVEKLDGVNTQWLIFKDLKYVGIVGLDRLPPYTMNIMRKMVDGNKNLRIIFLPSKADSVKYEKTILGGYGVAHTDRVISEKSRYTIFSTEQRGPMYLLLNEKAIQESTVDFLINLFSRLLVKIENCPDILEKSYRALADPFIKALFSYSEKMGIPFVYADEMLREFVQSMVQNIQLNYLECLALKDLLGEGILINELADYLEYKIRIHFEILDYEMRFALIEVYQTLEKMLLIAALMSLISGHKPMYQYLTNAFKNDFEEFRKRYSELPDLIRAIDILFANKERITYASYDEYAEAMIELIRDALCEIEPRYVSLGESLTLLRLSEFYLDGLDKGRLVYARGIGFISNYIDLLKGVFGKEGIYSEVRIMAGMALEQTLLALVLMDRDVSRYLELVDCTKQLSGLIENSLPEILKKNGTMSGFTGSPLTYEDAVLRVLSTSRMARGFGDLATEKELLDIAEKVAAKYDLPSIKVDLWWAKFIESQSFSYLFDIHEAVKRIDFAKFPYRRFTALPIDLLAQALLLGEDAESTIDHAQELALDGTCEAARQKVFIDQSIRTSQALYLVLEIFKRLLMLTKSTGNLERAYYTALALRETLARADATNIVALKTEILYKLTKLDFSAASELCDKLHNYTDPEGNIKSYTDLTLKWIGICKSEVGRRYVRQSEFRYDGNDIWMRILVSFVGDSMEDDLSKNIAGSKAIVFVEGETDALVLKEYASRLFPRVKIYFVDIEGYTNYQYYIEAKITRELKIPCYLILDGDTTQAKKADIIKRLGQLSLGKEFIYTLRKNSIEDYLLKSRAIKSAYPSMSLSAQNIEEFLKLNRRKRNKKLVLKALLKKGGLKAYDKKSAERIAHEMGDYMIEPELVHLITRICSLQKLRH
jgi:hypothetical protein